MRSLEVDRESKLNESSSQYHEVTAADTDSFSYQQKIKRSDLDGKPKELVMW